MIPKNMEPQTRSAQLETLHNLVAFYEGQIRKSLEEKNFRLAWSWHDSLCGPPRICWRAPGRTRIRPEAGRESWRKNCACSKSDRWR